MKTTEDLKNGNLLIDLHGDGDREVDECVDGTKLAQDRVHYLNL
jgi:hypothetical protein